MSEYWKSTPKYWCKHCSCYVRDTKLERQNHEATARHQGAIKRSLRELHRTHEREERDKERARREIARLNGVVSKDGPNASNPAKSATRATSSETDLKRQRQQLADLGVAHGGGRGGNAQGRSCDGGAQATRRAETGGGGGRGGGDAATV
ncbi:hypothetical protein CDD82_2238 [Ophiocordyceps australis]|uniref:U1-type domain-containing protein n=1 Tax=Ophiocordyceps australis TaxID=1399860 RepID=A0A2C5XZE7_9HYPO|nr:hypothetical protein CDD82_2238 [Ophiocordyceps australis]